jgi:hypothetical protein
MARAERGAALEAVDGRLRLLPHLHARCAHELRRHHIQPVVREVAHARLFSKRRTAASGAGSRAGLRVLAQRLRRRPSPAQIVRAVAAKYAQGGRFALARGTQNRGARLPCIRPLA